MNSIFDRLHGRKTPPGMELKILRRMPLMFAVTTLLTVSLSVLVRLIPHAETGHAAEKHIANVDIFVIATTLTTWTAFLTVAIGCVLVHIMKGPGYVADAYPLDSRDTPARDEERR